MGKVPLNKQTLICRGGYQPPENISTKPDGRIISAPTV